MLHQKYFPYYPYCEPFPVKKLKGLFEKEDIDSLRTLKFDLDEYEKLVGYEYKQEERGTVDVVQDGDSEGRDESKQG